MTLRNDELSYNQIEYELKEKDLVPVSPVVLRANSIDLGENGGISAPLKENVNVM